MNYDNLLNTGHEEGSEAARIGKRIQRIRKMRGLTQDELNEKLGLGANRIQKYENGIRKPKMELLQQIAAALDVNVLALTDPVASTPEGVLYAFFEIEDIYGLSVRSENGKVLIEFDETAPSFASIADYLTLWAAKHEQTQIKIQNAITEEEISAIKKNYFNWKWNFPHQINKADSEDKELRKAQIQSEIDRLEKLKNELG